ncbi:hypothetical protein MVEN_00362300 [Mycena venus]|uniref:Uncharacterized protein n=1 Tax=Mycena venus TaxID=2733690 RepID=A0A8H7DAI8_9AGAR|nr:hypothetical protein MVEN_00362300 [Mycena venus]
MSNSFSLHFPDRDPCFGDSSNSSSVCQVPTLDMINFLNISNPSAYLAAYCLNPPGDSCAFGYCPNPDVASPAVRISTYLTTIISAILVLYSPDDVQASFFSRLLNVYSLIIAAIISIANRNLTKPHTVVALGLAASPLSVYLIIYVIRSMIGNQNRLETVFGKGKWLNRGAVMTLLPVWLAVLVFSALPESTWNFQQSACDEVVDEGHVISLFFKPFLLLFVVFPESAIIGFGLFVIAWGTAIYLQRQEIWKKNKKLPFQRMWRKVVDAYPFIHFCTVILFPHFFWLVNIEVGVSALLKETFTYTYGQILALLVAIPPLIQLCLLLPRLLHWFADLTWVRLLTCRRDRPRAGYSQQRSASEFSLPLVTPSPKSTLYSSNRPEEAIPLQNASSMR